MPRTEEYRSIVKNEVREIVPSSKNKDGVSYRWLLKIKHATDGSIEKYKARFVTVDFPRRKALTMKRHSLQWPDTLRSEPL
jgi:hypothetical protein